MTLYQRLQKTIDGSKSVEEQREQLAQFDDITDSEVLEMAHTCHKSTEAGILLEYLGHEKLGPHLPLFLEFLQDMNWPAAGGAANMLVAAGKDIIPEIRRVFTEVKDDTAWHYWTLIGIVQNLDREMIIEMKPDLIELINRADNGGAATQALRILKEEEILPTEQIDQHYRFLWEAYRADIHLIKDLRNELANETY